MQNPSFLSEGDYDIRYYNRGCRIIKQARCINHVELKDGVGFGNLDRIWKVYNNSVSEVLPNKIILLYDCDTNKQNTKT